MVFRLATTFWITRGTSARRNTFSITGRPFFSTGSPSAGAMVSPVKPVRVDLGVQGLAFEVRHAQIGQDHIVGYHRRDGEAAEIEQQFNAD
ncbi:MAG: hypothetical protein ACREXK_13765 [Gammaproteobacteria bacterium]